MSSLRHSVASSLAVGLVFVVAVNLVPSRVEGGVGFCEAQPAAQPFARTELFFGLSRLDGSQVSEAEFQGFMNHVVTPLFPDGLTLLTAKGQFKDSSGRIVKETARLLVLLYASSSENSKKIERVREAYKTRFQQQSVLRVDAQSCVSF